MIKTSTTRKFSCFPTIPEEGAVKFTDTADYQSDIEIDKSEFKQHFQGINNITEDKKQPFATWQPFIPQKPVFQNWPAH